jgi:hypothetical protein
MALSSANQARVPSAARAAVHDALTAVLAKRGALLMELDIWQADERWMGTASWLQVDGKLARVICQGARAVEALGRVLVAAVEAWT